MLYGREREQSVVDRLLDAARKGDSGVLVLRGEPGIGKTALLDHAVRTADAAGMRLIRAAGTEYEADLPFAALHLLLRPALDRLAALPAPQRLALEGAFGLAAAPDRAAEPADRLLTGLALLSILSELAEEKPLLCVVDDAQWLDSASAEALLLAARRLHAEGIAIVLAARDGEGFETPGLPELRLTGLTDEASATLLDTTGRLTPELRHRVLAEAHGNPLALTELPAALAAEPGAHPGGIPLTTRLQVAFHGRISALPAATQTLLLVAAAEQTGDLETVRLAAEALGAALGDLQPAEEAGLLRVVERDAAGPTLAFRHPLLRAAVYRRAPLTQRLTAHRALAAVLDDSAHRPGDRDARTEHADDRADRRAWHLAIAAPGADEEIAAALERAAQRAHHRGGHTAAAAAYERSARLSTDRGAATRRLGHAAEALIEAGSLNRAGGLAERAAERTDDPRLRARLTHVRATARFWAGDFPAAYRLLSDGAAQITRTEPRLAARMLLQAFHAAWYLGEGPVGEILDRLEAVEHAADDPMTPLTRYVVAATAPLLGRSAEPLPPIDETVRAARRNGALFPWDLVQVCGASLILGRDTETYRLASALAAESRSVGGFGQLPTVQFFLSEAELFHGRHGDARAGATEALRIATDTGQRQWISQLTSFLAYLAAIEGDQETCRRLGEQALAESGGSDPMAPGSPWVSWAYGLLDLGYGRAEDALNRLDALCTGPMRHHVSATRAVPDLVEAAVRLGVPERAEEPYRRFTRWAALTGRPWARALELRCRALLDDGDPEASYTEALALHEAGGRPFEQARTALLYGEWLRRGRRKAEARVPLRTALEVFERLGAAPWADRARTELSATGEAAPHAQGPGVLASLTPQELQIVRLAAQGLSNRDIAAQLFLSPRTVGYHLYKAYPKLGVASRGELAGLED